MEQRGCREGSSLTQYKPAVSAQFQRGSNTLKKQHSDFILKALFDLDIDWIALCVSLLIILGVLLLFFSTQAL